MLSASLSKNIGIYNDKIIKNEQNYLTKFEFFRVGTYHNKNALQYFSTFSLFFFSHMQKLKYDDEIKIFFFSSKSLGCFCITEY